MRRLLIASLFATACGSGIAGSDGQDVSSGKIEHLVVIVQENHSFDAYFGAWCKAPAGSNPTCTKGAGCCEAAPAHDPSGASPVLLGDEENASYSPDHSQACELQEIGDGSMDGYVTASCGSRRNFALATGAAQQYGAWAQAGALADRYFQPVVGASSSNDMYLAAAKFFFVDNAYEPDSMGAGCSYNRHDIQYGDLTIADLLAAKNIGSAWYIEGYKAMDDAWACPWPPDDCTSDAYFPCIYDPSDVPYAYFPSTADDPEHMKDYGALAKDLASGTLPSVAFVKGLMYHNEHPGHGTTISNGVDFVSRTIAQIQKSTFAASTLILVTWDESGGYFDHVAPPPPSAADGQPYGPRVPLIAIGPFARKGTVSHVTMEHSSIVKFIEWNWLGRTGLLGARDAEVNNLGSLLDPSLNVPAR